MKQVLTHDLNQGLPDLASIRHDQLVQGLPDLASIRHDQLVQKQVDEDYIRELLAVDNKGDDSDLKSQKARGGGGRLGFDIYVKQRIKWQTEFLITNGSQLRHVMPSYYAGWSRVRFRTGHRLTRLMGVTRANAQRHNIVNNPACWW